MRSSTQPEKQSYYIQFQIMIYKTWFKMSIQRHITDFYVYTKLNKKKKLKQRVQKEISLLSRYFFFILHYSILLIR